MDEGYTTMVLDLHFEKVKISLFPTPQMAKSGACNSSILHPFGFLPRALFLYSFLNLNTNQSQGKLIKSNKTTNCAKLILN